MRSRRGILALGLLPAILVAAAVGVHASAAARTRAAAGGATTDTTYSCRVSRQHNVNLFASVTLPPANNQPGSPGVLVVTTGTKTVTKNGTTTTKSQVGFSARKNSLRIDKSSCQPAKKQIPLKSKGLGGPPTTVTSTLFGHADEGCTTAARVLVRLRVETTAGAPAKALLAVRNDNAKRRPIAFFNWSPRKVIVYTANGCVTIG